MALNACKTKPTQTTAWVEATTGRLLDPENLHEQHVTTSFVRYALLLAVGRCACKISVRTADANRFCLTEFFTVRSMYVEDGARVYDLSRCLKSERRNIYF